MKKTYKKFLGWTVAVVALSFCPEWGQAQYNADMYLNIDWQYNVPLGISFADKSSGWGMNFETGYYFPCNIGLGVFFAYHTNNEYVPRRTIEASPTSAVTTDQQHSLYQVPFGVTGRYRFLPGSICEPYVAMKLGANYARISSDFYILQAYEKTWGFYMSPELGVQIRPFSQTRVGFHAALYYSYATNQGSVMQSKIDQLNNFGFRLGLSF